MMNYGDGFTAEMSTELLSIFAKDEPSTHYMNAQVPTRAPPKGKGKGKDKSKDDSATPGTEGLALHTPISSVRIGISSQRFRYTHPNGIGKIRSTGISCRPISEITARFAAFTTLTPSNTPPMERSDTLPRKVRIRPSRGSWTFHRFSGQTRIAEEEMAACLNTSIRSSSIRTRSWYN